MNVRRRVGAAAQRMRHVALPDPALLPIVVCLLGRQVADREGRYVPGVMFQEELDAFVIEDVTVLHAVCPQPDGVLDRFRVGRMGHHLELAQVADLERRLQFVLQQEGVTVEIPGGPQDATRQVQLDVVDTILDLLADRLDEAVGSVAFERVPGGQEVAAGRREEVAGGEQARPDILARVECALPGDIHVVVRAGAAQSGNAGLGQRRHHAMAEQRDLVGQRHFRRKVVVRMDVDVPQSGHQVGAPEVDRGDVPCRGRAAVGADLADPSIFDQYGRTRDRFGLDAVDERGVGEESSHGAHDKGLSGGGLGNISRARQDAAGPPC